MAAYRVCLKIQGSIARAMWWIVPVLISDLAIVGTAQSVEQVSVPIQYEGRQIELPGRFDKPAGPRPFPAVIILHGCGGYQGLGLRETMVWSGTLLGEGYATLIIDSVTPRGYVSVCGDPPKLPASQRVLDVYAAAYLFAGRPDIRRDKIAVLGFSHGGAATLIAATMGVWPNGVSKGHLAEAIAKVRGQEYLSELQAAASALRRARGLRRMSRSTLHAAPLRRRVLRARF
jgi:acetyl esterase/lipase